MSRCPHCGIEMPGDYSFCSACEWIHLGIRPEVEHRAVLRALIILDMFNQQEVVKSIVDVHRQMVSMLKNFDEEDEEAIKCVGFLRQILEKAVVEELAERGYSPQGEPL